MTTPHPQILAWLAANAADCVSRTDKGFILEESPAETYVWTSTRGIWSRCFDGDAHAHIELGGWKAIRKWCKARKSMMTINEIARNSPGVNIQCGDVLLGSGPTDADAIWAALHGIGAKP